MILAVLFDFDGVLVSTVEVHAKAFRDALDAVWVDRPLMLEIDSQHLNGLSTREKLRYLTSACGLPSSAHDRIWTEKQRLTVEAMRTEITPDPEKVGMMRALTREGYQLACVSNAIRQTTVLGLRSAGLFDFFSLVLTNEDVAKQKPSPEPYLRAFRHLGVDPRSCLIVEDSPHGVISARESGAHVMEVSSYREVHYASVSIAIREASRA